MARRQRPTREADQENPGLQRPPPSPEDEPHRYLCIVVSFPGVILLGIVAALTVFLISVRSDNSEAIVTSAPSPEDPFWFDVSDREYLGNDDMALSFPTRLPTQNPTRTSSNLVQDDDFNLSPVIESPTLSLSQTTEPSTSPVPTQELDLQNAQNRFQEILESRAAAFSLSDDSSPQAKAYDWLTRDPQFYGYSDDRLLQRWVLATFAFGMVVVAPSENGTGSNAFVRPEQLSIPQAMQNWVKYTDECTRWFYTLGDDNSGNAVCNSDGLYVRLDLRLQNLVGTLPSEIALLSNHLLYIHLFENQIFGTVPTEFGLLTNLKRLELTKNNMNGELPTELGNLNRLRFLGLGQNSFSGPIPSEIGKLNRLNTIGLEWNQFTKIPSELGNMAETKILNMDHNDLSGNVPSTLGQLTNLEQLNLIFNGGLVGTMPDEVCDLDMEVLQADCDNFDCDCCTSCYYNN